MLFEEHMILYGRLNNENCVVAGHSFQSDHRFTAYPVTEGRIVIIPPHVSAYMGHHQVIFYNTGIPV
jgi:hypothetical protein